MMLRYGTVNGNLSELMKPRGLFISSALYSVLYNVICLLTNPAEMSFIGKLAIEERAEQGLQLIDTA
jgi:hypothetical protein